MTGGKRFALWFSETTSTRVSRRRSGPPEEFSLTKVRGRDSTSQRRKRVFFSNRWYELHTFEIWICRIGSCLSPKLAFLSTDESVHFMAEDRGIEDRWVETSSGNAFG
ncbi:hypothetical protein YC2023_017672 [Brassica napus]